KAASGKSLTAAPRVMLAAAPTGRQASNATNARTISAATSALLWPYCNAKSTSRYRSASATVASRSGRSGSSAYHSSSPLSRVQHRNVSAKGKEATGANSTAKVGLYWDKSKCCSGCPAHRARPANSVKLADRQMLTGDEWRSGADD